ncbi:hypothetical protein [Paraburkholderia caribensis]|uniref:hypothetical protein n=1 Tax=Paraburkholderia caribensis TaxID=75105 RepID=UPI0034D29FEC
MEIRQVVLCKQLFSEAERYLSRGTPMGHGLAVSIAQDAVELFLRAVMKERHAAGQKVPDEFIKAMDYIDAAADGMEQLKVPLRGKLLELNKARVNFKHYGLSPERLDAGRLVSYVSHFFDEATPRFFGTSFESISLADLLADAAIRDRLKAANEALADENFTAAMGLSAEVVELASVAVMTSLAPAGRLGSPSMSSRLTAALGVDAANELSRYMKGLVNKSNRAALMLALPVDVKHASRFEVLAPPVWLLRDGASYQKQWMVPSEFHTAENARFCVNFATEVSLAVDARMATPLPPLGKQGDDELTGIA